MWCILVSILHIDSAGTFSVFVLQAALCALTEEGSQWSRWKTDTSCRCYTTCVHPCHSSRLIGRDLRKCLFRRSHWLTWPWSMTCMGWMFVFVITSHLHILFLFAVGCVLVLGWTSESLTERFRENSLSGSVQTCGRSPYLLVTSHRLCMVREDICLYNIYILGVMKTLRVSKEIWWILFKSCVDMDMSQNAWNWRTVMCWNREQHNTHWIWIQVFWDVTFCLLEITYQCYKGCLHFQDQ